jgi:pimeloyl-ACP methyl ester carboxylesterase
MNRSAVAPVGIRSGSELLAGDFARPARARGLVLFAHGSGSGRFSPRNRFVADALRRAGLATLLLDLLTPAEERMDDETAGLRFDIPFLARRVAAAVDWAGRDPDAADLPVALFGASTGAAAALAAAAARPGRVYAVVSRGGRPDLAPEALPRVTVPVLLIVGGEDGPVIAMNRSAALRLGGDVRLEIVPGATHLFEESGALEEVARLARDWLVARLPKPPAR